MAETNNIKELIKLKMLSGTNTNTTKGMILLMCFPYIEKCLQHFSTLFENNISTFFVKFMNYIFSKPKTYSCIIPSGYHAYDRIINIINNTGQCKANAKKIIMSQNYSLCKYTYIYTNSFINGDIWIPIKFVDQGKEYEFEFKITMNGTQKIDEDGKRVTESGDKRYLNIRTHHKETLDKLYSMVDHILKEEKKNIEKQTTQSMYLFLVEKQSEWIKNDDDKKDKNVLKFNKYNISSKRRRTFDQMFFPQKNHILNCVNNFRDKKGVYSKKINKIGFLLHGEPGTGKTTFIKTLASYLKRHVVNIDLSHVYTNKQLEDLIFDCRINEVSQGRKHYYRRELLFVFEDIDCMGEDVYSRKYKSKKSSNDKPHVKYDFNKKRKGVENESDSCDDGVIPFTTYMKRKRTLNLSGILNVLDGIVDTPDRVIVITTNHPEKLDPALIRPGRIDHIIYMTYIKPKEAIEMIEYYLNIMLNEEQKELIRIIINSNQITPAEVENMCIQYQNVDKIVDALRIFKSESESEANKNETKYENVKTIITNENKILNK